VGFDGKDLTFSYESAGQAEEPESRDTALL
jgi:hypothetical protein